MFQIILKKVYFLNRFFILEPRIEFFIQQNWFSFPFGFNSKGKSE